MHGKLALHHPQCGIIPIAVSLLTIIWTTIFLTWIQTYLVADDVEDLALAYLLPTVFIAVLFGSTLAVASSFGDAPDFVELGEAGIAMDDAMRRQRRVQLVG